MYGFIHCCLEDMVLQLFGEPAWREILNISGIKLRGASFLMHQVYDDQMTFKLVAAASNVSGLPVEVCLEEFGKHFLVYCQKNGYDQILRVLGSNLYDFLTNLDNLHDHLASIYPGMRAPSFRVTRRLNTNQPSSDVVAAALSGQEQPQVASLPTNDELHRENATCSLANGNSMYLHYYSERAGLSPIVKGLVMAVAREFFQTDILVAECQLLKPAVAAPDDHVVLKIDRREPPAELDSQPPAVQPVQPLEPSKLGRPAATCDIRRPLDGNLFDSLSTSARDSLVSSDTMMQTFPFHVIFDRRFKLVQVGKSLLRVTSNHWRRHQQQPQVGRPPVRFGDLFSIVRPKIDFTFDAIADHTNQVFVVRTRAQVLDADALRTKPTGARGAHPPPNLPPTGCPMDRLALRRRRQVQAGQVQSDQLQSGQLQSDQLQSGQLQSDQLQSGQLQSDQLQSGQLQSGEMQASQVQASQVQAELQAELQAKPDLMQSSNQEPDEQLSLRLKGQMIILLGGELCLFLCSPRVDHLDQLVECGVRMSDFALHDRARELMLMSHTHKEDRETVKKLDQATNDLRKMDAKLRMENERTNEVLHNIFPAKIARLLSHGHQVESESFESVTCLYSDIIGFTKMCGSENVRPIDIVRLLNTLYLQFDNLTNIHQVFKVETIGDAYVVVGGLPEPALDHADRCVKMGLDMVKVIATVRSPADKQPIQMRIGIHSGPVMAGIVGIRVPRYSLFGNTTTLANQLETNGVGGKIHISDFTLKSLIKRDKFVLEHNPNELPGFPFSPTHFVTSYIGDQQETRQHERILEEQLIKDLQLMGTEVELVDLEEPAQVAALGASSAASQPAPKPSEQPGRRRTLGETLAAAAGNLDAGQLQRQDRLILMDIEERNNGRRQVQQMSGLLSAKIIGEALEQVAARATSGRQPSAAELLLGRQADLELVLRATSRRQQAGCLLCGQAAPPSASQGELIRVRLDAAPPPEEQAACEHSTMNLRLARPRLEQLLEWLAGGQQQAAHCSGAHQSGAGPEPNLERLLEELRLERRKLEAQVERLSRQLADGQPQPQVAAGGSEPASPAPSSLPSRPQVAGQPRSLLSSNIQRMKRMDTLKLRKLKKQQQQQQADAGSPLEPNGNSSAESSAGSRPRDIRSACSPVLLEEEPEQEEPAVERAAPSQRRPTLTPPGEPPQPPPPPKSYKIGNYNYQALRHSLAGLLGDQAGGPPPPPGANSRLGAQQQQLQPQPQEQTLQQQPTSKKRFSLNPFAGLSSPFGSPVKTRAAQPAGPKRGGSCSCLRSSASNQSVQSRELR